MEIQQLDIPEVLLIELDVHADDRGFFTEIFNLRNYKTIGIHDIFVQDNYSGSKKGTIRGLHYQLHHPQGKLVQVVEGEVFDVAIDLRRSSPRFGDWVGMTLSSDAYQQIWVPPGFAHGFYVLSDWAEVVYKVTDFYAPEWERTIIWNDHKIGIRWPLLGGRPPVLSERDRDGKALVDAEVFD